MSDMAEAGGGPLHRTINGQDVTFAELDVYERRDMLREYRTQQREALKALMDETGLESTQKYSELRNFDRETVGQTVWAGFILSDEGRIAILEKSLKKAGKGLDALKGYAVDGDDALQLCAAITHTKLGSSKGENPNPPQGAPAKGYGQE